ncbi:jasmonoyl--L-amino acid synthetase JAR4-like [Magnolia sinica]|uniref:jasmonoyl--L-amino acid synthetase JAR4-like n=1 Tax=Magnolia sinica TaxID=86752 RepID=UPI00265A8736|nr:jasmonoyl--L-amino acid synthetase JAR4-like [Magnolia sinica]
MNGFTHQSVIDEFEATTKDTGKVQIETLRKILEKNSETEYLQKLGLNGRTDLESFKACVPLATHKDFDPYIQRIADGDLSPVLTEKPIKSMSISSGTSQGKPKFLPFNEEYLISTMRMFRISFAFRNREFPIRVGKALQFIYGSKQFKTKGGLTAASASTNLYLTSQYKITMKDIHSQSCSPDEVIFSPDFHQSLYCHLLCGLIYSQEVQIVSSAFAFSLIHAFRTFEQVWEELCCDIRDGILSNRITVPSIRTALSKILKPNPELADSIYKKCSGLSNWYGVIPELWPNAKYVYGIMTGSMEPYLMKLRHYAGRLPLVSAGYGSSEGWIGANIKPWLPPELVTFTVVPDIGYFEFIPIREKVEDHELEKTASILNYIESEPIGLTEVKVGEEYEIVLTNFSGLYRYRLGDVVKVTGFHNSAPELHFTCRRSVLLTINIDKTTENDLQLAVEAATKLLAEEKVEVIDYTSNVDSSTDPSHYVIFWELSGNVSEGVLNECCCCLDQSFVDAGYILSRKVCGIGALELRVVQKGTFHKILDHYLKLGAAASQFKTPRCIGALNSAVLQILCDNVVESYFSTAFD